ncbi:MAG: DUF1015 domain-containing protein [Actinobacteria bacterium]|nr:DUF1015 domain-containing protein [Actinomycetota bacterium]MCA1720186.1 DUF1015 domain-containing protein [Actinomycetota bacterium]
MTAGSDPASSGAVPDGGAPAAVVPLPSPTGLVLQPFRALRFDTAAAGDLATLTSPPYDVIDADGVSALEASNDHNVVRLILPREPVGSGSDTGRGPRADRYAAARRTLEHWRAEGALVPDAVPALYVYEQADAHSGHVQRGLLGALALTPPEDDIVLPHENTMAGPVSDRLALYNAVDADLEPIFLVYDGGGAASRAVAEADAGDPLLDVVLPDGLRHRIWAITEQVRLDDIAADLHPRKALIADGHHRYATYLQRQGERRAAGLGPGPWDLGLTFLVDATAFGPEVHPIHRVVPGQPAEQLAERAAAGMSVRAVSGGLPGALAELTEATGPAYVLTDGDAAWLLDQPDAGQLAAALPAEHSDAWKALDVSVLHGYVVPTLWQLPDTVDTVGYEHDVDAAVAAARRTGGTAVLLNPTPVAAVAAVAAGGERMPRKSTLFTPKPRTGLVLRDYRDA